MMEKIETENAPKAIGPYSQAVAAGGFVFVSGQLPTNPHGTITEQTTQVLNNLAAILKAANLSLSDVVRCEVFLKDLSDFHVMNTIYADHFSQPIKPARQTIQVANLPLNSKIEISCIARKKP